MQAITSDLWILKFISGDKKCFFVLVFCQSQGYTFLNLGLYLRSINCLSEYFIATCIDILFTMAQSHTVGRSKKYILYMHRYWEIKLSASFSMSHKYFSKELSLLGGVLYLYSCLLSDKMQDYINSVFPPVSAKYSNSLVLFVLPLLCTSFNVFWISSMCIPCFKLLFTTLM